VTEDGFAAAAVGYAPGPLDRVRAAARGWAADAAELRDRAAAAAGSEPGREDARRMIREAAGLERAAGDVQQICGLRGEVTAAADSAAPRAGTAGDGIAAECTCCTWATGPAEGDPWVRAVLSEAGHHARLTAHPVLIRPGRPGG
jgi:hypothetical protein